MQARLAFLCSFATFVVAAPARAVSVTTNVVATTVSTSRIDITWSAVATAVSYGVYRSTSGSAFAFAGSTGTTSFSDVALSSNTTYEYEVQAIDGTGTAGPLSSAALATTSVFTDDPLVAGTTPVKGVHIGDLRTAVNSVRTAAALGAYSYTDATLANVAVKSTHVTELRDALNQALTTLSMPLLTPTNPATPNTAVAAIDLNEIRAHVSGVTSTQPAPISFCNRGPATETFSPSMQGCAGSVGFLNRALQCGAGYHVCSSTEYIANRNGAVPQHTYWTSDPLRYNTGGFSGNCWVSLSLSGTNACLSPAQMLVCAPLGDPIGNPCGVVNCGFNSVSPNQYFGGCGSTAGSLCCKDPIWYVDPSGSDANAGTSGSPFRTITHALSVATSGQQVIVNPGSYTAASGEAFPLVVPSGVALIGNEAQSGGGPTPTAINGCGSGSALNASANATVAGFTITCASASAVSASSGSATVRNNTLTGSLYGMLVAGASTTPVVTGNTITANAYGILFNNGSTSGKFEQNVIANNTQYGVYYITSGGDLGGGAAGSAGGNVISCNTFADLDAGTVSGVFAKNNKWDHAPPTLSTTTASGGIDVYASVAANVTYTGASVAPAPCP